MLNIYTTRTNEVYLTAQYEATQQPLTGAVVTIELIDTVTNLAISGTQATLTETTPGTYYHKYPILGTLTKDCDYALHVVINVNASPVVDEIMSLPVVAV